MRPEPERFRIEASDAEVLQRGGAQSEQFRVRPQVRPCMSTRRVTRMMWHLGRRWASSALTRGTATASTLPLLSLTWEAKQERTVS